MSFKTKLFLATLALILFVSGMLLFANKDSSLTARTYKRGVSAEVDQAVTQAELLYQQKRGSGQDISSGPCLSEDLMPNWVADLVHNPRQPEDNYPENQCKNYLNGKAKRFVELDLDGKLVRVH